jgi:hypothetical protein
MKITKTQLRNIIKEELNSVLSEDELEEANLAALNLMNRLRKKRQKGPGPGAMSKDVHKRATDAKEKTWAQRDMERREKEERERQAQDRRWRASLSLDDLAAEEEAEAFRQSMMEGLSKAKLRNIIKEELTKAQAKRKKEIEGELKSLEGELKDLEHT